MNTETTQKRVQCPSCNKNGKSVSSTTISALLKNEYTGMIDGGDTDWRFCDSQDCDIVYFSEADDTTFNKTQLKVSVGVKETTGERPLCYCFGHSIASIKEELNTKGHSDASEDIRAKMKNPGCRCETENPSGSCCLGSVTKGIKIAKEELGMEDTDTQTPVTPAGNKGEKIAKIGTIVSAIMASSCCWLPLLLLAVGVSGAGIASTLEAYRPLFMVVTFSFLGAAFYYTYRPKKAATDGGHGCCTTEPAGGEDCCAPTANGKFNMMSLNKLMLWGVTVMAVVFLLFPSYVGAIIGVNGKAVTENMNQAVFKIEGMTCEGCSATVATAIRSVSKVQAVQVSYDKGEAVVGTEIGNPIPKEEILAALTKAGYTGTFVESGKTTASSASASKKACCVLPKPDNSNDSTPSSNIPLLQTFFKIEGMSCEGCAESVTEAIGEVQGISSVKVDFKSGIAKVKYSPDSKLPVDAVLVAIKEASFTGTVVEEKTAQSKSNEEKATKLPATIRYSIGIKGMTCETCSAHAEKKLAEIPGVVKSEVDWKVGHAWVTVLKPKKQSTSSKTKPRQISKELVTAIQGAGYKPTVNYVINIDGMVCKECSKRVSSVVKKISGVFNVAVNLKGHFAVVIPTMKAKPLSKPIVKAIETAGFKAKIQSQP